MRKISLIVAGVAAATAVGAWAANSASNDRGMQDLKEEIGTSLDAPTGKEKQWRQEMAKLEARAARREALDVGDADSFGQPVKWLGLMVGPAVVARPDCTLRPGDRPDTLCFVVDQMGSGSGTFNDISRMTLPGGSFESTLCHWQTPIIHATLQNNSGWDNRNTFVRVIPTITVENAVLNAAGLIDPETGAPLAGKLEIYGASAGVDALLDHGERTNARQTSSRTCIGGYLTRRNLIDYYGLTEAQARDFFRNPTTLRLNVQVYASGASSALTQMSFRWVGH